MPELTWTTGFAWVGILASALVVGSWPLALCAWWHHRDARRRIAADRVRAQALLAQMHDETQTTWRTLGEMLGRLDTPAEARHRDLKDRLDGREG
jgi:hypothetical protein